MIEEYLEKLKAELAGAGADPALIQDAVYDAEEYFRSEPAGDEGDDPEDVFKRLIEGYGAPHEVAASYLEAELAVDKAMRLPAQDKRRSILGRFFGVLADPRTYGALFYMLLAMMTGTAYFTLAVTGVILSISTAILIFGLPFMLLFLSLVRGVSFVEGRLVEALLGVRMPRRPRVVAREGSVIERIKWWITDRRTWTTLVYMLVQLPLGIAYFTTLVTALVISLTVMALPAIQIYLDAPIATSNAYAYYLEPWAMPFATALGVLSIVVLMHLARAVGYLHGSYAKTMLVGDVQEGESR